MLKGMLSVRNQLGSAGFQGAHLNNVWLWTLSTSSTPVVALQLARFLARESSMEGSSTSWVTHADVKFTKVNQVKETQDKLELWKDGHLSDEEGCLKVGTNFVVVRTIPENNCSLFL